VDNRVGREQISDVIRTILITSSFFSLRISCNSAIGYALAG
jgi:hypothetical protein